MPTDQPEPDERRTTMPGQNDISSGREAEAISATFPFDSHFVEVDGSRLHYVEQGEGAPVLFLHGNPTWSYLWRNVIPHVAPVARCIALDLVGMGLSDKPDIDYRFVDHVRYLEGAIAALELEDVVLVLHDWGSALGFDYACRQAGNVRALAFMEAMLGPVPSWDAFPAEARELFRSFRTPETGWELIAGQNVFIEGVLPGSTLRELSEEELDRYRQPFPTEASRKPLWRFANEIPIAGEPADVFERVSAYSTWLQETDLPMLLFHASPGAVMPAPAVDWAKANLSRLDTVDLGAGIHFLQEDHPHTIGRALAEWLASV
jgi:haloalkane dehalogenase